MTSRSLVGTIPDDLVQNSAAIRLGIIGLGNIGRRHLRAAAACPALSVVAVADSQLDEHGEGLDEIAFFSRWEELLEHPELEAVSICVPHHLHAPMTLAALEAGKHVLVEKPLALDCEQGRVLQRTARDHGLTLMVEMTHRFYPPLKEAREIVQSGRLGNIYAVEDRIVEPVSSQLLPWMQRKSTAGGGVALTNGVHMLDRIAAVTGQSLTFQSGIAGYNAGLGDIEDTAAMLLSLENGSPVQLLVSWPHGGICASGVCDDELTIYGTEATLRVWAWRGWRLEPVTGNATPQEKLCYAPGVDVGTRVQIGVRGAIEEFADAIYEGREPQPTAQAALDAQMIVEEFYAFVDAQIAGKSL